MTTLELVCLGLALLNVGQALAVGALWTDRRDARADATQLRVVLAGEADATTRWRECARGWHAKWRDLQPKAPRPTLRLDSSAAIDPEEFKRTRVIRR